MLCFSARSAEVDGTVRLVGLSSDMSGAMFTQPVAWQPLPNRLVGEGRCEAPEVHVVTRVSVQARVPEHVCFEAEPETGPFLLQNLLPK